MHERAGRTLERLAEFYAAPSGPVPGDPVARALELFHEVAATVPAYRAFLAEHGVDPADVRTAEQFAGLPLVTKESYLRRYPLPERCRGGRLDVNDTVAVSSGSSGQPTIWPRSVVDELAVARRFEDALVNMCGDGASSEVRPTLVVVCFALGSWVGGMYTADACRHLAAKGYPVTVATPGNSVDEILRVVGELGPRYERTVLAGYPPFVKNVVDEGVRRGVGWAALGVRLLLAGEVFSESWRDLIGRRAGMADADRASVSLYGTADAGVLGNETPLSVRVRRFVAGRPEAARELFGDARLPTLVQYDPMTRFFETHDGTLLFTGDGGVPLIRYHIADEGGLLSHADVMAFCRAHGFDPGESDGDERPFVFVFGRSLFTVSFFGANVYPENVTVALEHPDIADDVTGKFVMQVRTEADEERRLAVVVERAPDRPAPDTTAVAAAIRAALLRLNSEFANYVPPAYQTPVVEVREPGDPDWFPPGVKHRYSRA
ncbi:phenylacetate--CoA ligase family protein [Dactylosporangium vinaceum]|uniref:Phenylacetate--CoA ligase family protein n=1 Tax=Dactylosporangium vinaceum TaxID=53362 RepID=A0ABV5M770_9ACTN|nr:phenylacetate--CoA ligase family protein [Dactylosporangium vinaceum]UAC00583.1 phenylacetate--CoA ligase family protein [Dactylosporangium vinaceum]